MTDLATAPPRQTPRATAPPAPSPRATLQSSVVAVAGLIVLVAAGKLLHSTFLTPPLAATAVIIAGAPATPPAQPRSVLGGHLLSALLGFSIVPVLGVSQWTIALAGGISLAVMAFARAVHAPAAATAALIVAQHPAVPRTLASLVVGCLLLILIGYAVGLMIRHARYPRYWW